MTPSGTLMLVAQSWLLSLENLTRLRPATLAEYNALSAALISSSVVRPSVG